jgi:glycosyltransferase involved in cell wall biosynthesis
MTSMEAEMNPDLRVAMVPSPGVIDKQIPSGITTIVEKYAKYLPEVGIKIVEPDTESFDIAAVHAGMAPPPTANVPFVTHCHGLYWSYHYQCQDWEHHGNRMVLNNVVHSDIVTVPSEWVAETFRRDMHLSPTVVPHGVDLDDFKVERPHEGFVLWNKNRASDVCTPRGVHELAERRPQSLFLTTFVDSEPTPNIKVTGVLSTDTMREVVKLAGVYLATVEETFGIGTLEAMAAGVPILGFAHGGTAELVRHGVNGYLVSPGDYDGLARGLDYCWEHRDILGQNGREMARKWTWENVALALRTVYGEAIAHFSAPHLCTVVIPCYNKAGTLERAVKSALEQEYVEQIIIVDNNSSDGSDGIARRLADDHKKVIAISEERQGVAHARNAGCDRSSTRYISCLDADDEMLPGFIEVCIGAIRANPKLGLAYTKMEVIAPDGNSTISQWPGDYDFVAAARKQNQVPTCCVFRRDIYQRLGGYRQRYAPGGAGAEDGEFWYRFGQTGFGGVLATHEPLFRYYLGGQVSGDPEYREPNYLLWHPETWTGDHPAGSLMPPENGYSHLIRKYNRPKISVCIPFTPDHYDYLYDAMDSLEGQTYKDWECILAYDCSTDELNTQDVHRLVKAYPFARVVYSYGGGAGSARNTAAKLAKGRYLLFLDADDWLEPTCLETMMEIASAEPDDIIYTDYVGRAYGVTNVEELQSAGRLLHYEEDEQYAIMRYYAADYDCERALQQPHMTEEGQFYIWNLITSLTPRRYHEEIGGFDEDMVSWEDWDYWLRMARAGKCFVRIQKPLVSYRFYTGTRREIGRQNAADLLDYLRAKYEGDEPMPCSGCGRKRVNPTVIIEQNSPITAYSSSDMVRVEFVSQSFGEPVTVRDKDTNQLHDYGFHAGGDTFMMLRKHAEIYPGKFRVIEDVGQIQAEPVVEEVAPTPPPEPIVVEKEPEPAPEPVKIEEEPVEEEPKPKKITRRRTTRKSAPRKRTTKFSSSSDSS